MSKRGIFLLVIVLCAALFSVAEAQTISSSGATSTPLVITRSLSYGSSGGDVSMLQLFLKNLGYFKYPSITGYFASFTWRALAAFQWDNGLDPVGWVGPKTRALVATLSGGSANSPNSSGATTAPSNTFCPFTYCLPPGFTPGFGAGGSVADNSNNQSGGGGSVDVTPPAISSIFSGTPGQTSTTITWTTDEAANTQVEYGTDTSYGSQTTLDATFLTSHSAVVSGLTANTTYHFRVRSSDASANVTFSGDHTFTTSVAPDITAPSVSITAPGIRTTVSGTSVVLTANASDNVAVAGVTFKINGVIIGSEDTSSPYSVTWDSTATSSGSIFIVAIARDTSNNLATSSIIGVTVDNTPPVISSIASTTDFSSAAVSWTTDENANSKVVYGLTTAYGSVATNASLVTSHLINISSLSQLTQYHFGVVSTDGQGNTSTSSDKIFTTISDGAAVVKNIVTDFGATCNGNGNDNAAFTAFTTWAVNWQNSGNSGLIELDIPSGSVCEFSSTGSGNWLARGIKQLKVVGYGATLSDNNGTGNGFFLGGNGQFNDNVHSARTATVSAGASSVTLPTHSDTSLFTVGQYALMTGLDLQGFGYPSNPRFFEYVLVTGINPSTGVVTFSVPLKNSYESTWPLYNAGEEFSVDDGGPATLYVLDPSWNLQAEYDGLTIDQQGQTYANGRSITYKDVTFAGGACGIPTFDQSFTYDNVTGTNCDIEVDKAIETLTMASSTFRQFSFQSASVNNFTMSSSTITNALNGSPINTTISNSTLASVTVGAFAYGTSETWNCTNCVIGDIIAGGFVATLADLNITYSNGIFAFNSHDDGPAAWAVPGAKEFLQGSTGVKIPFTVTDVTQDSTFTYVHTDLPGAALPPINAISIMTATPPDFTCTNCTGSVAATDLSSQPPHTPMFSYISRTLTGNMSQVFAEIFGLLTSIKINIITAYTGVLSSLNFSLDDPFVHDLFGKRQIWGPTINTKVTGERDIFATSTTGAQTGDNFSAPGVGTRLMTDQITPKFSANISGESSSLWPVVSIEFITNQNVDLTPPTTPTSLATTSVSTSNVALTWGASADISGIYEYQVYRDSVKIATTTATTYNDTGRSANTTYVYAVKAADLLGNVSTAAILSVTTLAPVTFTHLIFLTSGTTWIVPNDWNSSSNQIEVIGAGGGGGPSVGTTVTGVGGGGGAYAAIANATLTPGATVTIAVGAGGSAGVADGISGGNGSDTYLCNSQSSCSSIGGGSVIIGAKGGGAGTNGGTNGTGGATGSSIGATKQPGGNGGIGNINNGGSGGGGAGGPGGAGANGGVASDRSGSGGGGNGGGSAGADSSTDNGSNGGAAFDNTAGGSGGTSGNPGGAGSHGSGGGGSGSFSSAEGGAGGNGIDWDATHGSGGGGGGGGGTGGGGGGATAGGNGGLYGGGGGGGGWGNVGNNGNGGTGGQGIIVVQY
jgi:hypothetical protein